MADTLKITGTIRSTPELKIRDRVSGRTKTATEFVQYQGESLRKKGESYEDAARRLASSEPGMFEIVSSTAPPPTGKEEYVPLFIKNPQKPSGPTPMPSITEQPGQFALGLAKNLASDSISAAAGLPLGLWEVGKLAVGIPFGAAKAAWDIASGEKTASDVASSAYKLTSDITGSLAKEYSDYYGPLLKGDVSKIYEHPGQLLSDVASVLTAGEWAAATKGSKLLKTASKLTAEAEKLQAEASVLKNAGKIKEAKDLAAKSADLINQAAKTKTQADKISAIANKAGTAASWIDPISGPIKSGQGVLRLAQKAPVVGEYVSKVPQYLYSKQLESVMRKGSMAESDAEKLAARASELAKTGLEEGISPWKSGRKKAEQKAFDIQNIREQAAAATPEPELLRNTLKAEDVAIKESAQITKKELENEARNVIQEQRKARQIDSKNDPFIENVTTVRDSRNVPLEERGTIKNAEGRDVEVFRSVDSQGLPTSNWWEEKLETPLEKLNSLSGANANTKKMWEKLKAKGHLDATEEKRLQAIEAMAKQYREDLDSIIGNLNIPVTIKGKQKNVPFKDLGIEQSKLFDIRNQMYKMVSQSKPWKAVEQGSRLSEANFKGLLKSVIANPALLTELALYIKGTAPTSYKTLRRAESAAGVAKKATKYKTRNIPLLTEPDQAIPSSLEPSRDSTDPAMDILMQSDPAMDILTK